MRVSNALLPTTYVVQAKVMFSQVSVILFGGSGGGQEGGGVGRVHPV